MCFKLIISYHDMIWWEGEGGLGKGLSAGSLKEGTEARKKVRQQEGGVKPPLREKRIWGTGKLSGFRRGRRPQLRRAGLGLPALRSSG
jgi:hypothetical protein